MSRNSLDSPQTAAQELDQTQAKVTKANQHLIHLQSEVQAVLRRREQLSGEIEAETARLVVDRQQQLQRAEDGSKQRQKEAERQLTDTKSELIPLRRQKWQLEADISVLEADISALADGRKDAQRQLQELGGLVEAAGRQVLQLESRIQFLKGEIGPLETKQLESNEQVEELERCKSDLEANISILVSRHAAKKTQTELEISSLLAKQQELEVAQANMLRQYDQMSEEIAARAKVADERDVVLKRREAKVAIDEKMVARNAGLLNL